MANIKLKNSSGQQTVYNGVSTVRLPLADGGTMDFIDTSDATMTAEDIRKGKTGYGADGTKLTGAMEEYPNAEDSTF